jgi:hypothetical protein
MSLKLVREVTNDEVRFYGGTNAYEKALAYSTSLRIFNGWQFAYTKDGRDYYKPTHPTLKAHGDLGVAPTPAEMDMLNMDPNFARPVFVPKEKQFVDHKYQGPSPISSANLRTFDEIAKEERRNIEYLIGITPNLMGKNNG